MTEDSTVEGKFPSEIENEAVDRAVDEAGGGGGGNGGGGNGGGGGGSDPARVEPLRVDFQPSETIQGGGGGAGEANPLVLDLRNYGGPAGVIQNKDTFFETTTLGSTSVSFTNASPTTGTVSLSEASYLLYSYNANIVFSNPTVEDTLYVNVDTGIYTLNKGDDTYPEKIVPRVRFSYTLDGNPGQTLGQTIPFSTTVDINTTAPDYQRSFNVYQAPQSATLSFQYDNGTTETTASAQSVGLLWGGYPLTLSASLANNNISTVSFDNFSLSLSRTGGLSFGVNSTYANFVERDGVGQVFNTPLGGPGGPDI